LPIDDENTMRRIIAFDGAALGADVSAFAAAAPPASCVRYTLSFMTSPSPASMS
jgi:hypothetical protein